MTPLYPAFIGRKEFRAFHFKNMWSHVKHQTRRYLV